MAAVRWQEEAAPRRFPLTPFQFLSHLRRHRLSSVHPALPVSKFTSDMRTMPQSQHRFMISAAAQILFLTLIFLTVTCGAGWCQSTPALRRTSPTLFSNLFQSQSPGQLSLLVFGGGYWSTDYASTEQGFQLEQSLTKGISVVGRATGYQLYLGGGFDNPLDPGTGHESRFNFGRFEGGFALSPTQGTYLYLLGGGDVADSNAGVFEADFATWTLRDRAHPLNIAMNVSYNSQNLITSGEVDLRLVLHSGQQVLLTGGLSGAGFAGGFVRGFSTQGGALMGAYSPRWQIGFDGQVGYASRSVYGQIILFKRFQWLE